MAIFLVAIAFQGALAAPDHTLGDRNAPVTIVEYASLSCPFCAAFHKEILPWLKDTYIRTNKVRFVYRDYPLNAPALWGALLAHCVPDDRYFEALDLLFDNQRQWAFSPNPRGALAKIAARFGVRGEGFESCLGDETSTNDILEGALAAQTEFEIFSTPSFLINGTVISNQRLDKPDLIELIEKHNP